MIRVSEQPTAEKGLQETMTPMVDVIFSLLAFMMLMINAPLLTSKLDLPTSEQAAPLTRQNALPINLLIDSHAARWQLDNSDWLDHEQLANRLSSLKKTPEASLILQMDKNLPVQRLIETLGLLQAAGISATDVATINGHTP
ncbi:ExbD/TolR family protein [Iodobacter ciconiae]|uniref:Biopolymer transporter ExbD n=1 Tax=Iodobacter ciconiae TaxID=2496266 RepID=A0A3S8ZUH6_9NEIS|nr:biopolymer transporter ExbD [Iodobacter ciconiae]AZN37153.1 biopolymer transporter ExbD [Iodobacter ciconiae]